MPGRTTKPPLTAVDFRTDPLADVTLSVHVVEPALAGQALTFASTGNEPIRSIVNVPPRPMMASGDEAVAASLLSRRTRTRRSSA